MNEEKQQALKTNEYNSESLIHSINSNNSIWNDKNKQPPQIHGGGIVSWRSEYVVAIYEDGLLGEICVSAGYSNTTPSFGNWHADRFGVRIVKWTYKGDFEKEYGLIDENTKYVCSEYSISEKLKNRRSVYGKTKKYNKGDIAIFIGLNAYIFVVGDREDKNHFYGIDGTRHIYHIDYMRRASKYEIKILEKRDSLLVEIANTDRLSHGHIKINY